MSNAFPTAAQRLYDAATRWAGGDDGPRDPGKLIDTAARCLAEDVDSPHLRMLAGTGYSARADEIRPVLEAALEELGIPQPGTIEPWRQVAVGGGTCSRLPSDTIRFEIRPASDLVGGHEVLVYVNDVEMTSAGAGVGMDPFDILIPVNRLAATPEPRRVPVARCDCGIYGCGSTDALIVRDGDAVHWEWEIEVPMSHGVTFRADQYDAELGRVEADHSWERPEDTTARHVLRSIDENALSELGIKVSWAAKDHARDDQFMIALQAGVEGPHDADYQVFLRVPWLGRSPEAVAGNVARILSRPPQKWPVTFHCTKPWISAPPPMAGRRWRREMPPRRAPRGLDNTPGSV